MTELSDIQKSSILNSPTASGRAENFIFLSFVPWCLAKLFLHRKPVAGERQTGLKPGGRSPFAERNFTGCIFGNVLFQLFAPQ